MFSTRRQPEPPDLAAAPRHRSAVWLILIVAGIIFFPGLGSTCLWDEDEGFYASTALEMHDLNEWIVPHFNGALFGHKPPWMYWMMRLGYSLFGVGEWGARFFSAVFASLSVCFIYRLGTILFKPQVGLIGAFILATSLMFTVVGRSATPDAFLVSFTLMGLCWYAEGVLQSQPLSWKRMALIYSMLSLGVLAKGPIAIVFPAFIMLAAAALCRKSALRREEPATWLAKTVGWLLAQPRVWIETGWQLRPFTALAMLTLIAGPWFLLVGSKTDWEFHREFFGVHHFQRATSSMEGHRGSILYYPVSILVGMYPWTVATGAVLIYWCRSFSSRWQVTVPSPAIGTESNLEQHERQRFAWILLSIWIMIYLIVFSIAATKLPNYILPAYPALALVFAVAFEAWLSCPQTFSALWHRGSLAVLIIVGLVILGLVPALALIPIRGVTVFEKIGVSTDVQHKLWWLGTIGIPACLGGLLAWIAVEKKKFVLAAWVVGCVAVATMICFWNVAAPRLTGLQNPQQLVRQIRMDLDDSGPRPLASYDFFRPTMVFYNRSPVEKCYSADQVESFFSKNPRGLMIVDSSRWEQLKASSSRKLEIVKRTPRFPERGELLVIEPAADAP